MVRWDDHNQGRNVSETKSSPRDINNSWMTLFMVDVSLSPQVF